MNLRGRIPNKNSVGSIKSDTLQQVSNIHSKQKFTFIGLSRCMAYLGCTNVSNVSTRGQVSRILILSYIKALGGPVDVQNGKHFTGSWNVKLVQIEITGVLSTLFYSGQPTNCALASQFRAPALSSTAISLVVSSETNKVK